MGCVASRIDREEKVRICKERRRLMKQLIVFRREFAAAQLAYLTALKNTGVTLRQFTESDSLDREEIDTLLGPTRRPPSSPPLPLPPSPPPPPTFSPDFSRCGDIKLEDAKEEIIEIDEDDTCTPPPPPVPSNSWDFWDPFAASSEQCEKESESMKQVDEEENWAEANTQFEDDDREEEVLVSSGVIMVLPEKRQPLELVDDNSSVMSWHTKDTADMAMVVWRSKKTLAALIKELDDYFLKASACGKNVGVLMDVNAHDTFLRQSTKYNKRNRSSSGKVFSALTWSWSSKSFQSTRDVVDFSGPSDPCRPGSHSVTLEKLYAEEERLYNEVKAEEITKLEHERKLLLLKKQEEEDHDLIKFEKLRSSVESLQSDTLRLQQSISRSCSSILSLINDELLPQLTALTSGLMHMWQTMYQCHQVQNHIFQQASHLSLENSVDSTTDYRRQAAAQLKREVGYWYNSFCKLMKYQREYVKAFSGWIQLTNYLPDDSQQNIISSSVHALCEKWQLSLDRLPDKAAGEAIKSFLAAIHSIVLQQGEEVNLKKRSEKLEKKLQRESMLLAEMEVKFDRNISVEDGQSLVSAKNPLSVKRAKIEVLKKQVDEEKVKYLNSVDVTRTMTLNNLQTSLPNVFRALMGFSSAYVQALEVAV